MNINSCLTGFIPFGLRGTVVGKTDHHLIVLFDSQFLGGGTDVLKKSMYRGARVQPQNVINLTKGFTTISQTKFQQVQRFNEKPFEGENEYTNENPEEVEETKRESYLKNKYRDWENMDYTE